MIEPSVSEPTLIGANPAATPAPLPEDEPPGVSRFHSISRDQAGERKDLHCVLRSAHWAIHRSLRKVIESVCVSSSEKYLGLISVLYLTSCGRPSADYGRTVFEIG
jgi:hypothetical protein